MLQKLRPAFPGFGIWLLLLMGYALYLPGQQGILYFDDDVNLHGLSEVTDGKTALFFISSNPAGSFSRPIALASFLLNQGDWAVNPQGFLYINCLIHLLNGALLAWVTLRLLRLVRPQLAERNEWIALSAAGLWLLLPLLASTSLIIVQRMTSLSATFLLTGLLIYLIGLSWEAAGRVIKGRWWQAIGIGLGTLLATLSKENGALLPLYALILEATVLAGIVALSPWRRWRMRLLAVPPLALFAYLATQISPAAFAARDFTLTERLLTQPIILWDYLRLALLPRAAAFTPFHDDYPIAHGLLNPPTAALAILAWLIVLGLALWHRRRWPWFALAVLWYLGGHTLESSAIPLELYFEHRNYVPLMGLMLALAWLAWTATGIWQRLAPVLLASYALMLAAVLWQTTSLWGDPLIAGEIWVDHHPTSERAHQSLANRYWVKRDPDTAYQLLTKAAIKNPEQIGLAMQALQLACETDQENKIKPDYARIVSRLTDGRFSNAALDTLSTLIDLREQQHCLSLSDADVHRLLDGLLANRRYQAGSTLNHLHHMKARIYRRQKDFDGTIRQLKAAFEAKPDVETVAIIVGTLLSGGLRDQALAYLVNARQRIPANPALRLQWLEILDQLQKLAEESPSPH